MGQILTIVRNLLFLSSAISSDAAAGEVKPLQIGCIEPGFCILGPDDVGDLPDRGGTLGIKTMGTSHAEIGGKEYPHKFFEIYDLARGVDFDSFIAPQIKLVRVNRFLFNNEETLARYVHALNPGDNVEIGVQNFSTGEARYIVMTVQSVDRMEYKTKTPEYVTFEYGVQMARNQTLMAALAAVKEISPYIMIYTLGTMPSTVFPNSCIILGVEC